MKAFAINAFTNFATCGTTCITACAVLAVVPNYLLFNFAAKISGIAAGYLTGYQLHKKIGSDEEAILPAVFLGAIGTLGIQPEVMLLMTLVSSLFAGIVGNLLQSPMEPAPAKQ